MEERGDPDWSKYPVRVEFCFKSQKERDSFLGGLSDGFGENHCQLDWPWRETPGFYKQPRFAVTPIKHEWED